MHLFEIHKYPMHRLWWFRNNCCCNLLLANQFRSLKRETVQSPWKVHCSIVAIVTSPFLIVSPISFIRWSLNPPALWRTPHFFNVKLPGPLIGRKLPKAGSGSHAQEQRGGWGEENDNGWGSRPWGNMGYNIYIYNFDLYVNDILCWWYFMSMIFWSSL